MNINDIKDAQNNIKDATIKTPLIDGYLIKDNLWIKAENMQKTGSFKLRGAFNKLQSLTDEDKNRGIIAASAGNHAQGVAFACQRMGVDGIIVMPKTAPLSKVEATRSYGVQVELQGNTFNDAYSYAQFLQSITKRIFIEPFDDEKVIAGQGTIAFEILDDLKDVEVVLVPIGGGGLASGIAYTIKQLKPNCKVYGVQSKNAPSMYQSIKDGHITSTDVKTMADGIAVREPGKLTFDLCKQYLDDVVLVDDEEIAATILMLLEKYKLVAEGAGAIAVAAAIFDKIDIKDKKTVAILSGGNIDVNFLSQIIDLGLYKSSRRSCILFKVIDKPGNLKKIIDVLSTVEANVISVDHKRNTSEILDRKCEVMIEIETANKQHLNNVLQAFVFEGYKIDDQDLLTVIYE